MRNSGLKALCLGSAALALLAACGGPTNPAESNATPSSGAFVRVDQAPAGQLPDGVAPTAYRLDLITDPASSHFTGKVEVDIALDAPHKTIWLHALGPVVSSVKAVLPDGYELKGEFTPNLADGGVSEIKFKTPLPEGIATLVLEYDAPYNPNLVGLYKASANGVPYLATQMEPIDARRMVPSFDEPRFKTPWTLTVTAPAGQQVVANGPLVARTDLDDGMVRHEFAPTRQISSYLVALAVGPYDEVRGDPIPANPVRADGIPFRAYAVEGKGEKLSEAMDSTYELLRIQEEYFDYPYPYAKLDLIAAADFAYGAMENAGAIIYREAALLIDDRTSLGRKRGIYTTHAHELAHQWFGNLVTPKWWNDIWLNEAFATWMSYKTLHAYDPEGGYDRSPIRAGLGAMGADSLINARQIRNPITQNGDIIGAFDGITYSKGGSVLNMFETYLGADAFRDGMRLHMRNFADQAADVNDFMQSLADGAGNAEVVPSFKSFIFQPGIPFLDVDVTCEGGNGSLTITQSRYAPLGSEIDPDESWIVPFAARTSTGETVKALLKDKTSTVALSACADWVMPNANGTGYWRFNTSSENWDALANVFNDLTGGEQLVFADSLTAAFRAGVVSAEDMLEGVEATTTGEWDAVQQPLGALGTFLGAMNEDDKPAMRQWIADVYQPTWEALEYRPADQLTQGETLLRQRLYSLLVGTARNPDMRNDLKARAAAYVGIDGTPRADALRPAEFGTAMTVGAQDSERDFFDAAFAYAKASTNQRERRTIYGALAGNATAEEAQIIFDAAMDGEIEDSEILSIVFALMGNDAVRSDIWPQVQDKIEFIVEKAPGPRKPSVVRMAGVFCDAKQTAEAEAFFKANGELMPGYERPLAQSVEASNLCGALKAEKADELVAALN